jgi:hypothetical protein
VNKITLQTSCTHRSKTPFNILGVCFTTEIRMISGSRSLKRRGKIFLCNYIAILLTMSCHSRLSQVIQFRSWIVRSFLLEKVDWAWCIHNTGGLHYYIRNMNLSAVVLLNCNNIVYLLSIINFMTEEFINSFSIETMCHCQNSNCPHILRK